AKQWWPIPHMYATHQLSDNLWLGVGMFTKYGLGSQFKNGWSRPGTVDMMSGTPSGTLKSITLLSTSINPNIAYKVNDVLSLAAGVDYTWGYLSLNQRYMAYHPAAGMLSADARIHSENGYAFGWNLAAHAKLNDQWSAGLTYRAHEDLRFKGSLRARYADPMYSKMAFSSRGLVPSSGRAKLRTPDVFTAGIKYQPLQNLSFEFDTAYTVWSSYCNLSIDSSNPNTAKFNEQKNWHDTWAFTLGAEYAPLDWLTLRAGFTYETSPLKNVASNHYDYLVPSNGRNYYTLGVGFKYDKWTVDLAYMYIRVRGMNYSGSIDTLGLRKTFEGRQHNSYANNLSMTIGYRF
ncbi:MAG: outer membrane protein transport protein, partial [Mailhella sp.]|nr:outer membrane protein transport protein [Mailhella sp.]